MNYYQLWSKRVEERMGDVDRILENLNKGIDTIIEDTELANMVRELDVRQLSDYGDVSFGAVDGGEGLKELSGVATYLIRASALSIKPDTAGKGEFVRDLDLGVVPLDRFTKAKVQFNRARMEYEVATKLALHHKPDYLLIDGSLLVGTEIDPLNIPEYQNYITALRNLFKACDAGGIQLIGVSEDSASRGLINYIKEKSMTSPKTNALLENLTDAALLQFFVQKAYAGKGDLCLATDVFEPVADKGRDWIKKHTGIDKTFPTFYLQATRLGRALRVDFPADEWSEDGCELQEKARELATMLATLSQRPKRYGYPFPLYIAHQDAELPKRLMDQTSTLIERRIFKNWQEEYVSLYAKKRRDSRPGSME